jgi:hypothetical protein
MSLDATFSSDTEQDWLKINRSHERSGEEGLMLAVLQDALSVIRNGEPRAVDGYLKNEDMGRLVNEARAWVMSNDSSWPFSFVSICDSLNISVSAVRRAVGDLKPLRVVRRAQEKGAEPEPGSSLLF